MASPVVQEAIESSTATASTSHVVTLPTATAGQLLLIILDKGSTSATINAHASLTELLDEASANGLYIAYRWMDGTEPASYTLTSSASTRSAQIAYRISGAENPATTAPQIGTTATGTSATPDPPASAAPPSSKDYLFIAFAGMAGEEADDDTWGNTPPTNYTPSPPRQKACGVAGTNLGGLILSAERALTTGVAENPGTFGVDVSAAWRAQTITIHPATAAPQLVTPGTASLTLTAKTPTVSVSNNKKATPGLATLALSVFAVVVSASANVLITPGPASLTTARFAPTVTAPKTVTPGVASLSLTPLAPVVTAVTGSIATPGTATLSTVTFAPSATATQNVRVTPGAVALSLSPLTPTVTASMNITVTPGVATLILTPFAPATGGSGSGGTVYYHRGIIIGFDG